MYAGFQAMTEAILRAETLALESLRPELEALRDAGRLQARFERILAGAQQDYFILCGCEDV
jgi:hypothetical protein